MPRHRKSLINTALVLALLALLVPSIHAQTAERIRSAVTQDDLQTAETLLRAASKRTDFAANNYDYLLARVLVRRGNTQEAVRIFDQVADRKSLLGGYALWHGAELARRAGNLAAEQQKLSRLLREYPSFLHRRTAIERLGASYFSAGKYREVITVLTPISGTRGSTARESLARIGHANLALGSTSTARQAFESLLSGGLNDDASLKAVEGLDQIDRQPTNPERLRRARVYQFNRSFDKARQHWLAIVNGDQTSPNRAEALFQLGRGYFLEENYKEAITWYDAAYKASPSTNEGEEGFYFAGHSYQAMGQADRAIERYDAFLKAYPHSKYFPYAYLNAIDTLRSASRFDDALQWSRRAQSEARDPFVSARALFDQSKIRMTQGNFSAALADLTSLRSQNLSIRGMVAGASIPEVNFLRAYCLEMLGRFDEAVTEYLAMQPGRNDAWGYYGHQASERLRGLRSNQRAGKGVDRRIDDFITFAKKGAADGTWADAKRGAGQALRMMNDDDARASEMRKILRSTYEKLPGYQVPSFALAATGRTEEIGSSSTISSELLFLGLYDEAGPELSSSRNARTAPPGWNYTLAFYCGFGDCAERTLRFAESTLKSIPDDYRLELLPARLAQTLFPAPFREQLDRSSRAKKVDARLILAIARQESRYDPEVKSFAAARGFLQFISSTADSIAKQMGMRDFDQSDLYQPAIAIDIGAQYLRNLFDEFKTPQAVVAAYNGSEDSVRRWIARAQSPDVDRFVIEVAKKETRDYVFKVMNNYRAYTSVYKDWDTR